MIYAIAIWITLLIGSGTPESPSTVYAKGILRDAGRIAHRDLWGHPAFRLKTVRRYPEFKLMDATNQEPTLKYWQELAPRKTGRRDAVLSLVRPYTNTGERLIGGIASGICFRGVSVANIDATKERYKSQLTVAHEVGHQLGAEHSSNAAGTNWDTDCSIMNAVRCEPFNPRHNLKFNTEAVEQIDECLSP